MYDVNMQFGANGVGFYVQQQLNTQICFYISSEV